MSRKKVTRADIARARRDAQILALRDQGATLQQIADMDLGPGHVKTPGGVSKAIDRAYAAVPVEGVERLREIQGRRLERQYRILTAVQSDAKDAGNVDNILKANLGIVRTLERAAKLYGLDAPTQHEVAGDAITTILIPNEILGITAAPTPQVDDDEEEGDFDAEDDGEG